MVAELLEDLARRLVDEPGAVRVERLDEDDELVLRLFVAEADRGRVIGRQGRVARAAGAREQRRVRLEIVE